MLKMLKVSFSAISLLCVMFTTLVVWGTVVTWWASADILKKVKNT